MAVSRGKKSQGEVNGQVESMESALLFMTYEENLSGLMKQSRSIMDGKKVNAWVEESILTRVVDARGTLKAMRDRIETFETMMMVIENDILEGPRTTDKGEVGGPGMDSPETTGIGES